MLRSNSRSSLLLLQELEQIVLDIEERFGELRHNNINLIDQLAERLREEFFHLAISDQDERKVMSWVEAAKQEANSLFIDAQTLGAHLNWIKEKKFTANASSKAIKTALSAVFMADFIENQPSPVQAKRAPRGPIKLAAPGYSSGLGRFNLFIGEIIHKGFH